MSEKIPKFNLLDMVGCIEQIQLYIKGYDYQKFIDDSRTVDAVIRNLEVMGEAANRLPTEFTSLYSTVPWDLIIATRNRVIHGYDSVDHKIVWEIIINQLPGLKQSLADIIGKI